MSLAKIKCVNAASLAIFRPTLMGYTSLFLVLNVLSYEKSTYGGFSEQLISSLIISV